MKRFEQLENRLPLAAQVVDLNPGFYGSQIEPVRLVGDWLYLEATVGDERRLMKTDGESFVDLGLGHNCLDSFVRGEELVCVTEAGVDAFNFTTDTWSVLSDRSGGEVLNGETVMWFSYDAERTLLEPDGDEHWHITIDYSDLEGRTFHFEDVDAPYDGQYEFGPTDVHGDALIANARLVRRESNKTVVVRNGAATVVPNAANPHPIVLDGQLLFSRNIDAPDHINYITEAGEFVMEKPDRLYDFGTGAWIVDDGVISRYDDGQETMIGDVTSAEWSPTFVAAVLWDASELVFLGNSELWGAEPYKATTAGIQFLGNYGFGPLGFGLERIATYGNYPLMRAGNSSFIYDGDQLIPSSIDPQAFLHMSDTHVLLKHYTEPTGGELLQYELLPGDANLDGLFDSADLVHLFQIGEYEDDLVGNSSKATGDFDGDGEFGTSDLVLAFQQGTYETD